MRGLGLALDPMRVRRCMPLGSRQGAVSAQLHSRWRTECTLRGILNVIGVSFEPL